MTKYSARRLARAEYCVEESGGFSPMGRKMNMIRAQRLIMYKMYTQIGFRTNRQIFNKRFS